MKHFYLRYVPLPPLIRKIKNSMNYLQCGPFLSHDPFTIEVTTKLIFVGSALRTQRNLSRSLSYVKGNKNRITPC